MKKLITYYVYADCNHYYVIERFDSFERIVYMHTDARIAASVADGYNTGKLTR